MRSGWVVAAALAALLVLSYSGRWRAGRDSALYREVGHELAIGDGFTFRGEREQLIHAGYPLWLAAIERTTGEDDPRAPALALLTMTVLAAVSLLVVHRLVRARHGPAIALAAVALVGIDPVFLRFSSELRPDLPFLLAAMTTLLGAERLRAGPREPRAFALIGAGLAAGWLLHPACWFVAAALAIELGRERRTGALIAIAAIVIAMIAVDPRGGAWFDGDYGRAVASQLGHDPLAHLARRADLLLEQGLPGAICDGPWPPLLGVVYAVLLIAGATQLERGWTIYVAITLGATMLVGVNPRYYLAILPLLVVGWLLAARAAAARVRPGPRRVAAWCLALAPLVAAEAIGSTRIIAEQRGWSAAPDPALAPYVASAPALARATTADDVILASEPRVLSYLARRRVWGLIEIPHAGDAITPAELRRFGFTFVVLPDEASGDRGLRDVVRDAGLALRRVDAVAGLVLYRITSDAAR
jgi:hypothetical protein